MKRRNGRRLGYLLTTPGAHVTTWRHAEDRADEPQGTLTVDRQTRLALLIYGQHVRIYYDTWLLPSLHLSYRETADVYILSGCMMKVDYCVS